MYGSSHGERAKTTGTRTKIAKGDPCEVLGLRGEHTVFHLYKAPESMATVCREL